MSYLSKQNKKLNKFAIIPITNIDRKIHKENFGNYPNFAGDFAKFSNVLI